MYPSFLSSRLRFETFAFCAFALIAILASGCDCDYGQTSRGSELTVDPKSIAFELTPINQTSTSKITLSNKGGVAVEISKIALSEATNKAFTITTKLDFPITLQKDDRKVVELQFAPTTGGLASGTLQIWSDATNTDDEGKTDVPIRSTLNAPDPRFSCGPVLDFEGVRIGDKKTLECVLTNEGDAVWTITNSSFNEGAEREFFAEISFPLTIQPNGKGATIRITYSPQDLGEDQAELRFLTDGQEPEDAPILVLKGHAATAAIEVTPKALIFPFTSKGKLSKQNLVASSKGEIELQITGMQIDPGSSPNFLVDSSLTFPITIEVGKNAELPIVYKGGATSREQGFVTIFSTDPNQPKLQIPLFAVADGCDLQVSPRKLTFPTRRTTTVTLSNQGNRACTINSIIMDPSTSKDYRMIPEKWPTVSLGPNQVLEFFVEYRPSDNIDDKGKITIKSDDPDEPTIELELAAPVKVEACELSPNPSVLNFGRVPIGRTNTRVITLVNDGLKPCEITEIKTTHVAPAGLSVFQIGKAITTPLTLQPGNQLSVEILYAPGKTLWYEALLEVKSNDVKRPDLKLKILGSAAPLCIRAVPEQVNFSAAKTSCSSATQNVAIYNICTVPLTVSKISLLSGSSSEFKVLKLPTLPAKLNLGNAINVELSYSPTDLAADKGALRIENNSEALPQLDLPLQGNGVADEAQTDTYTQSATPKVDILFVIDDSYSMSKRQKSLAQNLPDFLNFAQTQNVDFQIAVTTTSIRANPSVTQRPGGCFVGSAADRIITPQTPDLLNTFQKRVQVGTGGTAIEQGLEAAYRALTAPLLYDPNCNLGFLRDDASLSIIFVTDEPDQSPQKITFYQNFFDSLRGANRSRTVQISAITAPMPAKSCQDATTNGLYWNLATAFSGATESICSSNWNTTLKNLANSTFGLQRRFFLSRPATAASVKVTLDGQAVAAADYTFDPKTNVITFKTAPKPGQKIEFKYTANCKP